MEQHKIRILSTRALDQGLIRMAAAKNVAIDIIPFIETISLMDAVLSARISRLSTLPLRIVFTSMYAVDEVANCLKKTVPDWRIYCIGHSTKKRVRERFGEAAITGVADSAAALADRIIADGEKTSLVFFCGNQRRKELPEKLAAQGIQLEEIVVYNTIPTNPPISKRYDGVLFFSPSAVTGFFLTNKVNPETVFFAIGNTTAGEIKKYGDKKIIIAKEPSEQLLTELVIHYFEANPIHH